MKLISGAQFLDTFPGLPIVTWRKRDLYQPESKAGKEREKRMEGIPTPAKFLRLRSNDEISLRTLGVYG
jgi:hypothetical protein